MKYNILAALLSIFIIQADAWANGCFVNFFYPSSCSNEAIHCSDNGGLNSSVYGPSVGALCNSFKTAEAGLGTCTLSYTTAASNLNSCVNTLASYRQGYEGCSVSLNSCQASLGNLGTSCNAVVGERNYYVARLRECSQAFNLLLADYSRLVPVHSNQVDVIISSVGKKNRLIAKLRAKCGRACKSVK